MSTPASKPDSTTKAPKTPPADAAPAPAKKHWLSKPWNIAGAIAGLLFVLWIGSIIFSSDSDEDKAKKDQVAQTTTNDQSGGVHLTDEQFKQLLNQGNGQNNSVTGSTGQLSAANNQPVMLPTQMTTAPFVPEVGRVLQGSTRGADGKLYKFEIVYYLAQ